MNENVRYQSLSETAPRPCAEESMELRELRAGLKALYWGGKFEDFLRGVKQLEVLEKYGVKI